MDISHQIDFGNGFEFVHEPVNFSSASADIIFTSDLTRASFANLTLVFNGDAANKIYQIFINGSNGGEGIEKSIPYRITFCGKRYIDLMLVLSHSSTSFSCDRVEVPAWKAGGEDWFDQNINSKSFADLAKQSGSLISNYYKKTPYKVTSVPNALEIVTISLSELVIIVQLTEFARDLAEKIKVLTADATEVSTVVGVVHTPVLIASVTNLIVAIAKIALDIILIANYSSQLSKQIYQRKKYKLCMREFDLWDLLCKDLGLVFNTNILIGQFANATAMPQKIIMPKGGFNTLFNGVDSLFDRPENEEGASDAYGYYDGTFADFIDSQKIKYNGRVRIYGNQLYFEKKDSLNITNYVLPNTGEDGYTVRLPKPFTTNLHELPPYYRIEFSLDESETNTLHRYRGTSCSVSVEKGIKDKFSGWGQGKIITINSALAKRKDFLNETEVVLDALVKTLHSIVSVVIAPINAVINVLNGMVNLLNKIPGINITPINNIPNPININAISQRIGWMELSSDSFNVPKTFVGEQIGLDWEVSQNSESVMSAINLLNTFHFMELPSRGNQWLEYRNNKIKFCCDDLKKLQGGDYFTTSQNKLGKFVTMKWNLSKEIADDIIYREKFIYLKNLKEKIIIDGK